MRVVISGSRSIKSLTLESQQCINRIMELNAEIMVGDAPGVDAQVQNYLKSKGYNKVTVYYAYSKPRNNAGFKTVKVAGSYSDRDRLMCSRADYGLAIWDGVSPGTAANIKRVKTKILII